MYKKYNLQLGYFVSI